MYASPIHVLVVEDDDSHARLIEMAFEDSDLSYTLTRVNDGDAALKYVTNAEPFRQVSRPGLILLDLRLPKMDGHEVLAYIKSNRTLRDIPIVIFSTSAVEEDKQRAYFNHVNSYLTKPVDYEQFEAMVRDLQQYWCCWNERSDSFPDHVNV